MKYRNPSIPEGINVTDRHPLRELATLLGTAVLLIALLSWLLGQFGGHLARLLPFAYEQSMVPVSLLASDAPPALQAYLDTLGTRVAAQMDLPAEMAVHLHFSGGDTVNAFATLGGNILLFRGLVEHLPNENALAMLLAHEIAHVLHRDPIVGIVQGAAIGVMLSLLVGNPDLSVLGSTGLYTQLHFSRAMERDADAVALAAVYGVYGHLAGAGELFDAIQAQRQRMGNGETPAIFSSHPLDQQRLQAITDIAQEKGWSTDGKITPLPAEFSRWMDEAADRAKAESNSTPDKPS